MQTVKVDAAGNVYLLGNTDTTDLATAGAYPLRVLSMKNYRS